MTTIRAVALPALIAGAIGFFVPLYWLSLGMLLFGGRQSVLPDLFWSAIPWTCPACLLPGFWVLLAPVANAVLYMAACVAVRVSLGPRRGVRGGTEYFSSSQGGVKPLLIAERVWLALSIGVGAVLTYLSGTLPSPQPLPEAAFDGLFSFVVLSIFAYALLGMGRLLIWTMRMPRPDSR